MSCRAGNSILHRAVLRSQTDVAEWIIEQYGDQLLWLKNTDGATALHLAAGVGEKHVFQLFD